MLLRKSFRRCDAAIGAAGNAIVSVSGEALVSVSCMGNRYPFISARVDFVDTTMYAYVVLLSMSAIELYGASVVMSMTVVATMPLTLVLVIPLVIPLKMRLAMPLALKFA